MPRFASCCLLPLQHHSRNVVIDQVLPNVLVNIGYHGFPNFDRGLPPVGFNHANEPLSPTPLAAIIFSFSDAVSVKNHTFTKIEVSLVLLAAFNLPIDVEIADRERAD